MPAWLVETFFINVSIYRIRTDQRFDDHSEDGWVVKPTKEAAGLNNSISLGCHVIKRGWFSPAVELPYDQ